MSTKPHNTILMAQKAPRMMFLILYLEGALALQDYTIFLFLEKKLQFQKKILLAHCLFCGQQNKFLVYIPFFERFLCMLNIHYLTTI